MVDTLDSKPKGFASLNVSTFHVAQLILISFWPQSCFMQHSPTLSPVIERTFFQECFPGPLQSTHFEDRDWSIGLWYFFPKIAQYVSENFKFSWTVMLPASMLLIFDLSWTGFFWPFTIHFLGSTVKVYHKLVALCVHNFSFLYVQRHRKLGTLSLLIHQGARNIGFRHFPVVECPVLISSISQRTILTFQHGTTCNLQLMLDLHQCELSLFQFVTKEGPCFAISITSTSLYTSPMWETQRSSCSLWGVPIALDLYGSNQSRKNLFVAGEVDNFISTTVYYNNISIGGTTGLRLDTSSST